MYIYKYINETIIINTKKLYKYQDNPLLQLIFVARIKRNYYYIIILY